MPTEKQLLDDLEKDTVDTSRWTVDDVDQAEVDFHRAESKLFNLATPLRDGVLRSWHVTDDPAKVVDILNGKGEFYEREGDLCGGLYVSAVPHYWEGRSQKKWEWLPKLSREERLVLYDAVRRRLDELGKSGYLTQGEYERGLRDIELAVQYDNYHILDILINQPYNINVIEIVKKLGLAKPFEPPHVPVEFVGRYLEFNTSRAIEANEQLLRKRFGSTEGLTRKDLCDMLRSYGFDGVFTQFGMGTNAELVIWNKDKITSFGDWVRQTDVSMGASAPKPTWFIDPAGESRFEALLAPNKTRAIIFDKLLKERFDFLTHQDIAELDKILESIGFGDHPKSFKRFEWGLLYNTPQIRDGHADKYFRGLRPQDLDHLERLVEELRGMMS